MTVAMQSSMVTLSASGSQSVASRDARRSGIRLEAGIIPLVPAPVIAQVSRSPAQVQLRRLLRGCEVVPLTEQEAHAAGELMGRAATSDDIRRLLQAAGATGLIIDV
jgi:hypothetical protein